MGTQTCKLIPPCCDKSTTVKIDSTINKDSINRNSISNIITLYNNKDIHIEGTLKKEDEIIKILFDNQKITHEHIKETSYLDLDYDSTQFDKIIWGLIADQRRKILSSNTDKLLSNTSLYHLSLNYYKEYLQLEKEIIKKSEKDKSINKKEIVKQSTSENTSSEMKILIRTMMNRVFPSIIDSDFEFLYKNLIFIEFGEGTIIPNKYIKEFFICMIYGEIGYYNNGLLVTTYEKGDVFGEYGVNNYYKEEENENKTENNANFKYDFEQEGLKALSNVKACLMSGENINILISIHNENMIKVINIIDNIPYIGLLTSETKRSLSETVEVIKYNKNKIIIKHFQSIDFMFVVFEGTLIVKDNEGKSIRILKKGDCYNEIIFIKEIKTEKSDFYIIALEDNVEIGYWRISKLKNFFGEEYYSDFLFEIFLNIMNENRILRNLIDNRWEMKKNNNNLLNFSNNNTNKTNINTNNYKRIHTKDHYLSPLKDYTFKKRDTYDRGESPIIRISTINNTDKKGVDSNSDENYIFERRIYSYFKLKSYREEDDLNKEIQINNKLYIILKGSVFNIKSKTNIHPKDVFGGYFSKKEDIFKIKSELFVLESYFKDICYDIFDMNNIKEVNQVDLKKEDYLKAKFKILKLLNDDKKNLLHEISNKLCIISLLSNEIISSLLENIKEIEVGPNEILKQANEDLMELIYISSGRVIKIDDKDNTNIETYSEKDIIGLYDLFESEGKTIKKESVLISHSEFDMTRVVLISKSLLIESISNELKKFYKEIIEMEAKNIKIIMKIDFSKVEIISLLGKGSFGKVFLIKYMNQLLAMKVFSHSFLLNSHSAQFYFREELLNLSKVVSPFISLFRGYDFDQYNIYLFMNFSSSVSIKKALDEKIIDNFSKNIVFYMINLLIVIEYLHNQLILHRDIKPENIILLPSGYIQLIDFGLSKKIKDFTSTIVGSPYFMSPEIILGKGYGRSCDYWSIAVTIYEMFYSKNPFMTENDHNVISIYDRILNCKVTFPQTTKQRSIRKGSLLEEIDEEEKANQKLIGILEEMLRKEVKYRISLNRIKEKIGEKMFNQIKDMVYLRPPEYDYTKYDFISKKKLDGRKIEYKDILHGEKILIYDYKKNKWRIEKEKDESCLLYIKWLEGNRNLL